MMMCSHNHTKAHPLSSPFLEISQKPVPGFPLASGLGSPQPAFSRLKGVFQNEVRHTLSFTAERQREPTEGDGNRRDV